MVDSKRSYSIAKELESRVGFSDVGDSLKDLLDIFDPLEPNIYVLTNHVIKERELSAHPREEGQEDQHYAQITLLEQNIFGRLNFIYFHDEELDLEFFPELDTTDKILAFLENPYTNGMLIIPYTYHYKSEEKCPFIILGAYDAVERRIALEIRELERIERMKMGR